MLRRRLYFNPLRLRKISVNNRLVRLLIKKINEFQKPQKPKNLMWIRVQVRVKLFLNQDPDPGGKKINKKLSNHISKCCAKSRFCSSLQQMDLFLLYLPPGPGSAARRSSTMWICADPDPLIQYTVRNTTGNDYGDSPLLIRSLTPETLRTRCWHCQSANKKDKSDTSSITLKVRQ